MGRERANARLPSFPESSKPLPLGFTVRDLRKSIVAGMLAGYVEAIKDISGENDKR